MKDEPGLNESELLYGKPSGKELSVYRHRGLVLSAGHMNMRLGCCSLSKKSIFITKP